MGAKSSVTALIAVASVLACNTQKQDAQPAPTQEAAPAPPAAPKSAELLDGLSEGLSLSSEPGAKQTVRSAATPVAESEFTERQTEGFTAAPQATATRRSEGVAARQTLPPVAAQVPGIWIGWYVNRSIDALREAIDRDKPLVLVIGEDWCSYCSRVVLDSLRCPAVQRFAGDAVFVYTVPSLDKGGTAIAGSLKIDAYPTVTVLEPESRILLERGRINGFFEAGPMGEHFDTILWKTPARRLPDNFVVGRFPFVAPLHAQSSPRRPQTTMNATLGASQRGLKHAPPEPRCR